MGSSTKAAVLVVLVLQNSALALFMRYSRSSSSGQDDAQYATTTAVVCAELTKVVCSILLQTWEDGGVSQMVATVKRDIFGSPLDMLKMSVPAGLYVLQNNLAYVAISNLEGPTYQLLYQLKILTTALLSMVMLNKAISITQWISLAMLALGVGLVQMAAAATAAAAAATAAAAVAATGSTMAGGGDEVLVDVGGAGEGVDEVLVMESQMNSVVGIGAVLMACCTSGFAGVYFEKVLKGSKVSLWVRNIQLASFGLLLGLFAVFGKDGESVRTNGFFYGYNVSVWAAVALNSLGGLVVAMVVKYADNIVKGFATSLSIVLTCIVSYLFFDFSITYLFIGGGILVIAATFLYGYKPTSKPKLDHQPQQEPEEERLKGREAELRKQAAPKTPESGMPLLRTSSSTSVTPNSRNA